MKGTNREFRGNLEWNGTKAEVIGLCLWLISESGRALRGSRGLSLETCHPTPALPGKSVSPELAVGHFLGHI